MSDSTGTRITAGQTTASDGGSKGTEHGNPEYIAFVLVPVFFMLGLLGVLICHVLKRKGYRCTTETEEEEEEEKKLEAERDLEKGKELNDTYSESNNDTVSQIVHYIMNNEANSDALNAMIHENSIDSDGPPLTPTTPSSPTTPISPGSPISPVSPGAPGAPAAAAKSKHTCNHLHTIGGVGGVNICNRCSHKKGWPLRRPSNRRMERRSQGEVTVLAVGRFRVTKCEKPARERRTLLISEPNGGASGPHSRTTSESQEQANNAK